VARFNLTPQKREFFDLFTQASANAREIARLLVDLLAGWPDSRARLADIREAEHEGDRLTREVIRLLNATFVTPLDRDDIHRLISRMDDVLDLIQDVTEALQLYDIQKLTPEAVQLAELLKECCYRMQQAVKKLAKLEDSTGILKLCNEIDQLESQADTVMRTAISKLFREEGDVRQLIKLETVYQLLEAATDQCEDVANLIEGVVLEHA